MYRYKLKSKGEKILEFDTGEGVFFPTETSTLLIEDCQEHILNPGKTLDLGCGVGINGLVLAKLGRIKGSLYASDINEDAIVLAKNNAHNLNVDIIAKCGSLFEPWEGETFDIIINDVSGIADDVAKISPWFPSGVLCGAGYDGTRWIRHILKNAPRFLKQGGQLFFPVLSLSDESKILSVAEENFSSVCLLREKEWFLPEEMVKKIESIKPLMDQKVIQCQEKFGLWIWSTKVYCASND